MTIAISTTLALPPHSVVSEQCILGALLLDNRAWERLDGQVESRDFYRHDHRLIFAAIELLLNQGQPADVLTVSDLLTSQGKAEETGGIVYLNDMAQSVPSSANIRRYGEIVRAHRVRRDVMEVGSQITALAAGDVEDSTSLVEQATGLVMTLADSRSAGREPVAIGDLLPNVLRSLEARIESKGSVSGLSTGFADLDYKTSGLQKGDLIVVAGRPSMGKTTFALNIAENVSMDGGVALVVSLEMSAEQLTERSIARFGQIDTQRLRTGKLSPDDYTRLTGAFSRLQDQNLVISDDHTLSSAGRIRLAARRLKQRKGALDLIMVDYLQLMKGEGGNRNEELGSITRQLKLLAREMECPLILLSQLSRKVEERTDKRPIMSDLRESGAIEQDADVVMMAYRDEYYNEGSSFKGLAEILIRKQRMGPLGEVFMVFQGQHSRFLDADPVDVIAARNATAAKPKARYSSLRD